MQNIKLVLAYDGTAYAGWQRQKGQASIQQSVEEALRGMTGRPVVLIGAGRTDAGVHADGMVANFLTEAPLPARAFYRGLNNLLPADIRVLAAENVALDFHARYKATAKAYEYRFALAETLHPCLRLYVANFHGGFDQAAVEACLPLLIGRHDFRSFEASGSRDQATSHGKGAVRTIFAAQLFLDSPHLYRFRFVGDGFLRHMVRNIVGTLLSVGRGRLIPLDFAAILHARDRNLAGATAPACGLNLKEVYYQQVSERGSCPDCYDISPTMLFEEQQ